MAISKRTFLQAAGSAALLAWLDGCAPPPDGPAGRRCRARVRRNVYALLAEDPNHPVLATYAAGVAAMKSLDRDDPTSWAYQANIHGTRLAEEHWPAGAPWATCPHHDIMFLAWHRLYLYQLENIIADKTGTPDFAMPYWDYGNTGERALPPLFRDSGSALFEMARMAELNMGGTLPAWITDASTALAQPLYLGPFQFQSILEARPHDLIHDTFGGKMESPDTAAQDPIFWLHHSNTDRLQERWLRSGASRDLATALSDPVWPDRTFRFVRPDGTLVDYSARQTVEILRQLNYVYDEDYPDGVEYECPRRRDDVVSGPSRHLGPDFGPLPTLNPPGGGLQRRDIDPVRDAVIRLPIGGQALDLLARRSREARYYLVLEGVTARVPPGLVFAVQVGESEASAGADPEPAGFVSFFGRLEEDRHRPGKAHPAPPIVIDLTNRLLAQGLRRRILDRREVVIRFVPLGAEPPNQQPSTPRPAPGSAPRIGGAWIAAVPAKPRRY